MLKKLEALIQKLSFVAPTVTRLVLGYGFYFTGKGKLNNLDNFVELLKEQHIPFPEMQANFVAHLEYFGGMLLLLGALTRVTAFFLSSTMVVAIATADRMAFLDSWNPSGDSVPIDVSSFVYLVMLVWLVFYGAGWLSVDGVGRWLWSRRRPAAPALQSVA